MIEVVCSRSVRVALSEKFEVTDFFISEKAECEPGDETATYRRLRDRINANLANDIFRHFKERGVKTATLDNVKKRYGLFTPKETK